MAVAVSGTWKVKGGSCLGMPGKPGLLVWGGHGWGGHVGGARRALLSRAPKAGHLGSKHRCPSPQGHGLTRKR